MRDTDRMSVVGKLRAAMQAVQVGRFADALVDLEWCREVLSVKTRDARTCDNCGGNGQGIHWSGSALVECHTCNGTGRK